MTGALKMLHARHSRNAKRYERFRHEVTAQYRCQDIAGVLPLIDSHIPQNPTAFDPPWLVSALAIPLARELGKKLDLERTVAAFESLSKSLAEMHVRRISHRDLKPDKLFCLDGEFVIGDFGLADYPSKPPTSNE